MPVCQILECWELLNRISKRKIYIVIGVTMAAVYVGFMALPYFENMYYYGSPTPNFTKIGHDLFEKKLNPAQKKIFLQQEASQNKTRR